MLPTDEAIGKLETAQNIWIATIRPDGRPHLAPVWFVYYQGRIYISTEGDSVKARNLKGNPNVAVCLEDGTHPVICEGTAAAIPSPAPEPLSEVFINKYEWNLNTENQYSQLIEITPARWLVW